MKEGWKTGEVHGAFEIISSLEKAGQQVRSAAINVSLWTLGILGGIVGLAWWLQRVPTYATLYGAFATLPIFLIWIYLGWVIVLLGALLAANAPGFMQGLIQRAPGPGLDFGLSLGVVRELWARGKMTTRRRAEVAAAGAANGIGGGQGPRVHVKDGKARMKHF